MKFYRYKTDTLNTIDEMNQILQNIKDEGLEEFVSYTKAEGRIGYTIHIEDNPLYIKVTGRFLDGTDKVHVYLFAKDGRKVTPTADPSSCYREMKKYVKVDDIIRRDKQYDRLTSSPFLYSAYQGIETQSDNCICYDTNLTYFHLLNQKFPDTTRPLGCGVLEDGMVGFNISDKIVRGNDSKQRFVLEMSNTKGSYCQFRFNLIDSPFSKYIEQMEKQLEEHPEDRKNIKSRIVISVGNLQHHNPIWRAYIVESGNQRIKDLMDKNSIYCNTDCIVSTKPRDDIKVSKEIGDFKIEHQGTCWINGMNIRWDDGTVKHRGANISNNKYRFNREKLEIEEIK